MTIKVGINGFGRIGRFVFRASIYRPELGIQVVGINDLLPPDYMAYMLKYDTMHGQFQGKVEVKDGHLVVNGNTIRVTAERDPANLKWGDIGVDYVVESTGFFLTDELARKHIQAGARRVVMSAPSKDSTPMFVMGVNNDTYAGQDIVSNASCTTNCLAPLSKVLEDNWGIEEGLMSTIHAATAKQKVVDARSMKDWRTGRSVFNNIIPTTTGAAKAVALVIPSLKGKMTGIAYRVPTADVSVVDLNVRLKKPATYAEVCAKVKEASETYMKGVIEYVDDEVVSSDFIGDPCTSIFDAREGFQLNDRMFKFISFYDNEYGYSSKIVELIKHMASVDNK